MIVLNMNSYHFDSQKDNGINVIVTRMWSSVTFNDTHWAIAMTFVNKCMTDLLSVLSLVCIFMFVHCTLLCLIPCR